MITLQWLLAAFVAIALGAICLHKYARLGRVFCCALCVAACACAVMVTAVLRWMPQAYRPVIRMQALQEQNGGDIWLRNAFSFIGDRSTPAFPWVVEIGAWTAEDGLRWHAGTQAGEQGGALVISVPAAQRYALFFGGNRHTGKVLLTYPSGESRRAGYEWEAVVVDIGQVIDTHRDSDAWEAVVVDLGFDGSGILARMRRDIALAVAGCGLASALLFAALYRLLRRHRAALGGAWRAVVRGFERKLLQSRLARAPLDPRRWSWALFGLFALFLAPLLVIAVYAHPTYDDYIFGLATRQAWQQTGSMAAVFRTALEQTRGIYIAWQGSFSAVFLMTLQPGIFGEQFYILAPYLLIATFVAATWLFARAVIGKRYGGVLCWLTLFFSVQFLPGADEAFYWFNGGIYYTFFYSLSLLLYSLVLWAHRAATPTRRVAMTCAACLLALFVGGGNYVSALLSCVLLALLTVYRCVRRERRWWIPLVALLCLAGSLMASAVAPGNAFRQAESQGMPYLRAVALSFPHAAAFLAGGMRVEYALGAVIALPFLYRAAEGRAFSFRYPGLVTLASLCAYACQFAPHLAALSKDGPPRMMDIIFYTNFWLIGGNLFYWCGWRARRKRATEAARVVARWAAVAAAALLVLSCAVTAARQPDAIAGASAAMNLIDGRAARYGEALAGRRAVYEDESVRDAVFLPLPEKPHVLKYTEMVADPTDWLNASAAIYYGKDTVSVAR